MIRKTSIETYHQIKEQGLLSRARFEIYDVLFKFGPLTRGEIDLKLNSKFGYAGNVSARLTELRNMTVIEECGEKECSKTGMTVILWDVTEKLPVNLKKKPRIKCYFCNGTGHEK